jgi:mRNA interferase RelE/StbE
MQYRLNFHSSARKQLQQLDSILKREFLTEIRSLTDDPYPAYALAMRDQGQGFYRIHVNGWRLVYRVDEKERVIYIERIAKRTRNTYL